MVFILDSSDNVDQETWLKIKQYVLKVTSTVQLSPQSVRVGLLNAGQIIRTPLKLTEGTNKLALIKRLSEAGRQQGDLNLDSGFSDAENLFARQSKDNKVAKVAVFITKGDGIDAARIEKYIEQFKNKDVILKIIRISDQEDTKSTSGDGLNEVLVIKNANKLPSTISDLSRTIADTSGKPSLINERLFFT